jgi:sugar phosphate isomerase/epimerase
MALGPNDMVLGYMSMTRIEPPWPPWRLIAASFEERCTAAAAGGFAGIGIIPSAYDETRALGHSDAVMRAMLDDRDLVVAEVEAAFPLPGRAGLDALGKELDHVLEVADVFDAERVFFVAAPGVSIDDLAATFGWVCDRCAQHDLIVALEFMDIPSLSGLPDAATALQVVQAAGRANGGLLIDAYHQIRGSNDWSQLESVDGGQVAAIQLTDLAIPRVADDYLEDTIQHRRLPGEGDADLIRFVRTLDAIGATCPYSIEVSAEETVKLPATELGERLGTATRHVLEVARDHHDSAHKPRAT